MNYGSVCSGVEAATLAWAPLGWKAVFFAEVEPFPAAVLQQRFGATRPLRLLPPEEAETEKERKHDSDTAAIGDIYHTPFGPASRAQNSSFATKCAARIAESWNT